MNEKIEEIREAIKQRRTPIVYGLLNELDGDLNKLEKLQEFFNEVKKLVRNLGKSNMIHKEEFERLIKEFEK